MWGQNNTSDLSSIELGHNVMGLGAGSASEPRTSRSRDLYTDFTHLLPPQEAAFEQASNQEYIIDPRMANPALFIPQFVDLRRRCREHLENKLQRLEDELTAGYHRTNGSLDPNYDKKLDEATELLNRHDREVKAEIHRMVLQDPDYAQEHGLSIIPFASPPSKDESKRPQYMMLSKAWGKQSKTIMERHTDALQPYERRQLEAFLRRVSPTANTGDIEVWYQRRKHSAERLWHAVIYRDDGSFVAYPKVIRFYKVLLWVAGVALICYYGVGIIATNTTFAPLFHKFFFWIAILWSLSASALLSWLVWVMGAGKRDVLASFLSALALWLVVIQVGIPVEYMPVAYLAACLLFVNTDWADTLDLTDRYEFARSDTDCYDSTSRDTNRHRLNRWDHLISSPTPQRTGISQLLALTCGRPIEKDNKTNRVTITTFDVCSDTQRPT